MKYSCLFLIFFFHYFSCSPGSNTINKAQLKILPVGDKLRIYLTAMDMAANGYELQNGDRKMIAVAWQKKDAINDSEITNIHKWAEMVNINLSDYVLIDSAQLYDSTFNVFQPLKAVDKDYIVQDAVSKYDLKETEKYTIDEKIKHYQCIAPKRFNYKIDSANKLLLFEWSSTYPDLDNYATYCMTYYFRNDHYFTSILFAYRVNGQRRFRTYKKADQRFAYLYNRSTNNF